MSEAQRNNPLHGVPLERIVTDLFERYGWESMGRRVQIRCFQLNPSIKSSLTFLRRTPWARKEVEDWYVADLRAKERQTALEARRESAKEARRESEEAKRGSAPKTEVLPPYGS